MQDRRGDEVSSKQRRGAHLPPLAPRDVKPSSTKERTTGSSSTGRPPRLSHRSRAGCWTCRGRKVKCDEQHPRCGPCTRLNRECDWDHRWNFNDATTSTKGKYSNISTAGNAVWDPSVRRAYGTTPSPQEVDDLPEFAVLTNTEDRERKAGTQRPGTFGVVVTPESFYDLPEYAATSPQDSRRMSTASSGSTRGARGSGRPGLSRSITKSDPTVVVLEKFEDASPPSMSPFSPSNESRRSSFPDALQHLSIATPSYASGIGTGPNTPVMRADEHLTTHFRQYIVPRLAQPQQDSMPGIISQGSTKDVLESETNRFPPLHHAICAISALNLAYSGRSSLEEAMQHYHQALAASATPVSASSPSDLLSDGVFFRHFLLFVYDICMAPLQSDDGGTALWAEHLNHLKRIALQRRGNSGQEVYSYTLWSICELDVYACLLGNGSCDFVGTMMNHNLIPPLEHQIPSLSAVQTQGAAPFLAQELAIFPPILRLNQGILLLTAKIARTAQNFHEEISPYRNQYHRIPPENWAHWQSTAAQLQSELSNFWAQYYPEHILGPVSEYHPNTQNLPERIASVFENACLLYHATTLYARTSLFPRQRTLPTALQASTHLDSESRVLTILSLARSQLQRNFYDRRRTLWPVFMAGVSTAESSSQALAMDVCVAFEGKGIGQNTYRTRLLLGAVFEAQMEVRSRGGRVEEVDWLGVAREKGLGMLNCGL